MKFSPLILLLFLLGSCEQIQKITSKIKGKETSHTQTASIPAQSIVAKDAAPLLISKQFKFTEGPACDRYGNIYFSDQPNDKIWKYDTSGKLGVFLEKAGRSNGLYFDQSGNLLACADEKNELWSISPKKKVIILIKNLKGKKLNGPNDLWVNLNGDIYFTDPYYQRYYWKRRESELDGEKVYLLRKGAKEPVVASAIFKKPNGIIGTPDGRHLYVSDIDSGKTYRFDIAIDGSLLNGKAIIDQGSDGMTIDNQGNVYLTGAGVTVYNSEGQKIHHIDINEPWTANVCFGGKKRNKLFITASSAIYVLDMLVSGY